MSTSVVGTRLLRKEWLLDRETGIIVLVPGKRSLSCETWRTTRFKPNHSCGFRDFLRSDLRLFEVNKGTRGILCHQLTPLSVSGHGCWVIGSSVTDSFEPPIHSFKEQCKGLLWVTPSSDGQSQRPNVELRNKDWATGMLTQQWHYRRQYRHELKVSRSLMTPHRWLVAFVSKYVVYI